jgi:phosphoglycerate dehydrogenase-like enzyme
LDDLPAIEVMGRSERKTPRIITRIPVQELWAGQRLISTIRKRDLDKDGIIDLLRSGEIRFAVADIGEELQWIANTETYEFWKREAKMHLAFWGEPHYLEAFPDSYFYIASEWESYDGAKIVLLEKYH